MSAATVAARETTVAIATGKSRDRTPGSLIFLGVLWFSLFFGIAILSILLVDTAIKGFPRMDGNLLTEYDSTLFPEKTGFRAGILGSIWLMIGTALCTIPLGIAAATYLEEFADTNKWYNRIIEINIQNLAAIPAIVYGILALGVMGVFGMQDGLVIGGILALSLLTLPVIIITTREALRSVPGEIRQGSLALGATVWQTTWRNTLPSAIPGIATGTILGLSRAIGEAAPLIMVGVFASVRFDPGSLTDLTSALPIQIYGLSSDSREVVQQAANAAIILLLVMVLALNALAIFIRNKFQRSW